MYLQELIPNLNLEDEENEFKGIIEEGAESGSRKEIGWLKELVAFANSKGGNLYIGVNNKTHEILSLDHQTVDRLSLMVQRLVKAHIEPPIRYQIIPISIPGTVPLRYVLKIAVSPSRNPPISLRFNGLGVIYSRHFGETSVSTGEEIRAMVMRSESVSFDNRPTDIPFRAEDFTYLFSYYAKKNQGEALSQKALMSIGFIAPDGNLSQGALLFRDDYAGDKTRVDCTQFLGVDKGDKTFYSSKIIKGNLLKEFEEIRQFVLDHSANGFVKEADKRVPLISYPERALSEGIVNALGHRNYFILGSQIEINLYLDRLEIVSPGSLPSGRWLNREKALADIPPIRRNEVICSVFSLCKIMEEKGSGFDEIMKDYSPYGESYAPFASADSQTFALTLPNLAHEGGLVSLMENPNIYTIETLPGKNDVRILSYCYNRERDAKSIAKDLNLEPSSYFRKAVIGRLVKDGYLLERKEGKTTFFHSNPEKVKIS